MSNINVNNAQPQSTLNSHTIFTTDCERFKKKLLSENQVRFYLFGYGSLLWKLDFAYERKIYGYCQDYRREFWLLSDDHRGTPERYKSLLSI